MSIVSPEEEGFVVNKDLYGANERHSLATVPLRLALELQGRCSVHIAYSKMSCTSLYAGKGCVQALLGVSEGHCPYSVRAVGQVRGYLSGQKGMYCIVLYCTVLYCTVLYCV